MEPGPRVDPWGTPLMQEKQGDLGFTYLQTKSGDVRISHFGREVTVLRGKQALQFNRKIDTRDFAGKQQLMARATGHYKHGNER